MLSAGQVLNILCALSPCTKKYKVSGVTWAVNISKLQSDVDVSRRTARLLWQSARPAALVVMQAAIRRLKIS